MSGDPALIVLPSSDRRLLDAIRSVLATPGLPPVALIGGLAVAARMSAVGIDHRATVDIDLVTVYLEPDPEVVEVIAEAHQSSKQPLIVEGVKVDIIPTSPVAGVDLNDFDDQERLFLSGHRWAFQTAVTERLTIPEADPVIVRVATPAGLLAAKSHAVGYPSSTRRATKHGSDLLDLFRLIDQYGIGGALTDALRAGPSGLPRIIADVCDREFNRNPANAINKMAMASPRQLDPDHATSTISDFVYDLRR